MATLPLPYDSHWLVGSGSPELCSFACHVAPRFLFQHGVGSGHTHPLYHYWNRDLGESILC